jgi:glutaconate CoA-transferase subunit B
VSLEQIRDSTAFDVIVEGTPPVTAVPTDHELELLRKYVDRRGDLRRKFP